MPYLKPESTSDTFDVFCRVTDGGNPYRFHVLADIRGQLLDVDGLSMGELVTVNREITRAIRDAKHARHLEDRATWPVRRGCVAVGAAGGWFVRVLAVAVGRR